MSKNIELLEQIDNTIKDKYKNDTRQLNGIMCLFKTNIDNTYIEESFNMSLTKEERKNIKVNINYYDTNVTNIVGNLTVTLNKKEYFKTNIIKKENVKPKETFFQKLKRKILNLW